MSDSARCFRHVLFLTFVMAMAASGWAQGTNPYKVLEPMVGGNLQVFPVVSSVEHPPGVFLTLAEGLATGDVAVMERGKWEEIEKLRTPGVMAPGQKTESAQVGRLVLVNKTRRPLMMLGGEVLTGGKQDRVVGYDRLVPANSGAVDLDVFCVEPHRWTGTTGKFGGAGFLLQPSVRLTAISTQSQRQVWNAVGEARKSAADAVGGSQKFGSSSYAAMMENQDVRTKIGDITGPIREQYEARKGDLKFRNMVGVVVAVDGRPVWADVFATTEMLEAYWPKLLMSYAAEAVGRQSRSRASGVQSGSKTSDVASAEAFLRGMDDLSVQSSRTGGIFEQVTMCGGGYRATEVRSTDEGYVLHAALMVDEKGKCK